jgi:hypothetical protein
MKIVDRHLVLRQLWKVRKCTSRTNLSGVPPNMKADLALSRDGWDIWQTRQLTVALLAGGSGASHGTQHSGMAQQVFHLAMQRGRKIAKIAMARRLGGKFVLDVAHGPGI